VVSAPRGRVPLGCLVTLLLLTAALYFGVNVGEAYLRYFRYRDAMRQETRFARIRTDQAIARRLAALADSLGLPEGAHRVDIRRDESARRIAIQAYYAEEVELPGFVRTLRFSPRAEGGY
jgi:hypothetical protein